MFLTPASFIESNEFLNLVLNNIHSAVFISNEHAQIISINNAFKNLFHKKDDEIIGQSCGNVFGCEFVISQGKDCGTTTNCGHCKFRSSLVYTFMSGKPVFGKKLTRNFYIENRLYKKYFKYSTSLISYQNADMVLIILDDITQEENFKRMLIVKNRELKLLNRKKNEFLGIATHDLRSPIAQIISFVQLLKYQLNPEENQRIVNFLDKIDSRSQYALNIINDFLNYSNIETGIIDLRKQTTDYLLFVKELVMQNQLMASKKNITLSLLAPEKIQEIEIDTQKIEQVINNLILNAIKFSYSNTKVEIIVSVNEKELKTTIKDYGTGIDEKKQKLLFKSNSRLSEQGTGGETGSGLGLLISKIIISEHGGEIGFTSEKGKGSEFWFTLPK